MGEEFSAAEMAMPRCDDPDDMFFGNMMPSGQQSEVFPCLGGGEGRMEALLDDFCGAAGRLSPSSFPLRLAAPDAEPQGTEREEY